MQYDFENAPDRSKTDSVKWDVKSGELPMWTLRRHLKLSRQCNKN